MKKIILLSIIFSVFSCSSGGGSTDESIDTNKPVERKAPTAAVLVFPTANSECTEGTNITTTESTIKFQWTAGANTTSYGLVIKNLKTGSSNTFSTSKTYYDVKLTRGNAYSWYVVSSANGSSIKANSEVRKFYNAGDGISSYAPFPAETVSPKNNEIVNGSSVTLDWSVSDVDNDIVSYKVFLGTTANPGIFMSDITNSILNNVSVISGTTYYWKVETKDSKGNTSTSDIFKFSVN